MSFHTMNQQTARKDNGFLSALAEFERCLETPVVPGELPNWANAARAACESVGRLLREKVDEALGFVIQARKQQTALKTWYVEAFQRDRGVAD